MSATTPLTTAIDAVSLATNNSTGASYIEKLPLEWKVLGGLALVFVLFLVWFFLLREKE